MKTATLSFTLYHCQQHHGLNHCRCYQGHLRLRCLWKDYGSIHDNWAELPLMSEDLKNLSLVTD